MMPSITTMVVKKLTIVKIDERKSFISSFFCFSSSFFSSSSLKVGMKATVMLFSAKRRRKRFGIRNDTVKASAKGDVPRKRDFTISRISPKMRENNVRIERESPLLTIEAGFFVCLVVEFISFQK